MKPSFNPELEHAAQDGTEWKFGAIDTDLAIVPAKDRMLYVPEGVLQFNGIMDTNGCASRAPKAILATKFNYFYDHGMHPALQKWCNDKGYRKNGKFVFDETFIEILSETKRDGNSLKAPVDTARKFGLIPECLPLEEGMTWEQYMDKKRITEDMLALGREFLRRFTINYEQVQAKDFLSALEEDLVDAALYAWPIPVNGVYRRTEAGLNHAVALANPEIKALDSYDPFVKLLSKDYNFFPWGYSISITNQNPYPDEAMTLFEVFAKYGLLKWFDEALKRLNATAVTPTPTPVVELPKPIMHTSAVETMAKAIEVFEDYVAPGGKYRDGKPCPNGSVSWRNKNPGNCKGIDGKFKVFPTYEDGLKYLKDYIIRAATGKHGAYPKAGNTTLKEFFNIYAPSSDNNHPDLYASFVASKLAVGVDYPIKNLLG